MYFSKFLFFILFGTLTFLPNGQINKIIKISYLYNYLNHKPIQSESIFKRKNVKLVIIKDIHFQEVCLDSTCGIKYYEKVGYDSVPNLDNRDFLIINEKKILIDHLIYGKKLPSEFSLKSFFNNAECFNFNKRKYMALFSDVIENSNTPNYILILLDVTRKEKMRIVLSEIQASENIQCFGDFNEDSNLDYLQWSRGKYFTSKMEYYTLNNHKTKFKMLRNKFIYVEEMDSMDKIIINLNKSKYFGSFP